MGRKNLFHSVMAGGVGNIDAEPATKPATISPGHRGAVGAVSQSIQQMRAASVLELEADLIDPSFINDRIDVDPKAHAKFVELIRDHGQQVPILVRPHPEKEGRYQIVYGRRRLRAALELGRPVRAQVKRLTDEELVVAQGQENTARADLSFIERALFAAALERRGFDRETIMASLAVDKSGLSRLISSAVRIPRDVIDAIGPAPGTGRDRWVDLATKLEADRALTVARAVVKREDFASASSDDRFTQVLAEVGAVQKKPSRPRPQRDAIVAADGRRLATVSRERGATTLKIDEKAAPDFASYLARQLPEIYAAWKGDGDA